MIAVLGLGFIGLTVALGFAECGDEVYGVEIDDFRAELIRNGKIPYYEPGLDEALISHLDKNFHVVEDIDDVPNGVECFFVCVGSPTVVNGKTDFSKIYHAIGEIMDTGFEDYSTIAIKTPMLPGTMDKVILPYLREHGVTLGQDAGVVYNPEFIREGRCWDDFTNPTRIVVGVGSKRDEITMRHVYESFGAPITITNYKTAEFSRYMSSTLLATMISYSNEMAQAANDIGGIDIAQAFKVLQQDRRWQENSMKEYVYPGCGFGGIALPKDTDDFIQMAEGNGASVPLLRQVMATNDKMPLVICDTIAQAASADKKIGILGLTFKEGSSDVRNSASARIIDQLLKNGYRNVYAYDPIASDEYAAAYHQDISYCFTMKELCDQCDVVVIATPWRQFKTVGEYAKGKTIIDCRYML